MCDFKGRLVAWMDGELAENEAAQTERHLRACADCRERVAAYQGVSRGFADYYATATLTTMATKKPSHVKRWVPVLAAAAAVAALVLALLPRPVKQVPAVPRVVTPPSVAVQTAATPLKPAAKHQVTAHRKAPRANWAMAQPAIQIAIPAEAMFPPGAVPEGVNYIANLSLAADGSVQRLRLQP
jgi:anti-sigma factor RsiW